MSLDAWSGDVVHPPNDLFAFWEGKSELLDKDA
jgi:hypothetical protein